MKDIQNRVPSIVIGIAGGTASGKSAFTTALSARLSTIPPEMTVRVIHTDAYFRPGAPEMPTFLSPTSGEVLPDYNHPDSIDLGRLLSDITSVSQASDAPDVLIIEGLMVLYHTGLRKLLDLALFVELEDDTRALRRLVRNLEHPGDPISSHGARSIANYYLESAQPGHERYVQPSRRHADFILRGDGNFERTASMVATIVRGLR